MGFLNFLTFGLSNLLGHKGKKADPYQALLDRLNPLINQQTETARQASAEGFANTGKATTDLNFVSDWFKNILSGSDDNILKMFDTSSLTKNIDENEQILSNFGVRGGNRAAALGGASSNRDAAISKALQALRFAAPEQLADIASRIGALGTSELGIGTGAAGSAESALFGIEGLRQADRDRRSQLIGSIFEAIGTVAGAVACIATNSSKVITPIGTTLAKELDLGTEIKSSLGIVRKIIRIQISKNRSTRIIKTRTNEIEVTPSHVFGGVSSPEVLCSELQVGSMLQGQEIISISSSRADVVIFKLDNEEANYLFKCNGFWSFDADCQINKG